MELEFRILTGHHAGIVFPLKENTTYQVGSDLECDIYLYGLSEGQEGVFFEFRIHGNQIFLHPVSTTLLDIQKEALPSELPLALPLRFYLFDAECLICDKNASEKENIHASPILPPAVEGEEEEVAAPEKAAVYLKHVPPTTGWEYVREVLAKLFPWVFQNPQRAAFVDDLILSPLEKFTGLLVWPLKRLGLWKRRLMAPLLFLLCLCIGLFFILNSSYRKTENIQAKRVQAADDLTHIKKILLTLPSRYSNLQMDDGNTPTSSVTLLGVVETPQDLALLKKQFESYQSRMVYHILLAPDAVSALDKLLQQKGLNRISAQYDKTNARMALIGIVPDLNNLNDIELDVSMQYPQLGDIDTSQVFTQGDIEKDLGDILKQDDLDQRLIVQSDWEKESILVTGYLEKSLIPLVEQRFKVFQQKYVRIVKVDVQLRDILSAIPFKISQVYIGAPSMFVTQDNEKIFEGGEIAGMKVLKITPSEIVFFNQAPLTIRLDDILE